MTITAVYPGTCPCCGRAIPPSQQIHWHRGRSSRHPTCTQPPKSQVQLPADAIRISGSSGYGGHPYQVGQTLRAYRGTNPSGQPYYSEYGGTDGEAVCLTVLQAREQYVPEDGMSFGVGNESGYLYDAVCRLATDAEAAPLIAAEQVQVRRQAATQQRREIARRIRSDGERPSAEGGLLDPEGERLLDTQTIYGGGDWFLLSSAAIWYVRNNGADGDDWSLSNIRTGGAGAIGWRVPYTPELEQELRQIAAALRD